MSQLFIMKQIFRHGFRGGRVSVFGVKFLNRVDIRNFHECYPLKICRNICKVVFLSRVIEV